jgi:hypothetical protein
VSERETDRWMNKQTVLLIDKSIMIGREKYRYINTFTLDLYYFTFTKLAYRVKCLFIEAPFHQKAFSPKRLFIKPTQKEPFIKSSFHRICTFSSLAFSSKKPSLYTVFLGESESAVRFVLALLGAEIQMLKLFRPFSSKLRALLREGQAGSSLVFSLVYLTLSLPWLMELWVQP